MADHQFAIYDPPPAKRARMQRAARKLVGICPQCQVSRPLHPKTGICWPCDNLVDRHMPNAAIDRQKLERGEMCNDCAFRPGSPESKCNADYELAHLHVAREGDSEKSPRTILESVIDNARRAGGGVFYCHKPFIEPDQKWGYDKATGTLVPLYEDEHWRACAGWIRVFGKDCPELKADKGENP